MPLTYQERIPHCKNQCAQQLLTLVSEKETNLAVSADLNHADDILKLADTVGPHIALLKTHIDTIDDYSPDFITALNELSQQHHFMIFEDRKFADIGNTVKAQYASGLFNIADWSDITNAHILPGEGIIQGLKEVGLPKGRGLLLLAEMSSKGHLLDKTYQAHALQMAQAHDDFVIGFITQHALSDDPAWINMTPGIKLQTGNDALGQQYTTPDQAIRLQGADIIIVGRGIYASNHPGDAAAEYREAGWAAYRARIKY